MANMPEENDLEESRIETLRERSREKARIGREGLERPEPLKGAAEQEALERLLALSFKEHIRVTVVVSETGGEACFSGFVTSIHAHTREIKLQWAQEWKWISLKDIAEVYA